MTQIVNENTEQQEAELNSEASTTPLPEPSTTDGQLDDFDPKERVEINDPKVAKKFNHIYKQMKMSDSRNQMYLDLMQKQQAKIDELESRFKDTDTAEAERVLLGRMKEAREVGDEEKADKIMLELIDFKSEQKIKSAAPKDNKQKNIAEYDPDVQAVVKFAQETDLSGNPIRPWLAAGHPQHDNAMKVAGAIALEVNADLGYVDVEEVFIRMDKAMSKKQSQQASTRSPEPMRGGLTNRQTRGTIKLSSAELDICKKMNVSPEEYTKWKR